MIQIKNLQKSFDNRQILNGINLDIQEGQLTSIIGLSGMGKSTIIKHIVGLLNPDSGEVIVDGKNIHKMKGEKLLEIRKNIGFLFQNAALFDSMTIEQNLCFPLDEHSTLSREEKLDQSKHYLNLVGLDPNQILKLYPNELSGGMQKRVALARVLILKPKYILYDEPTSSLDPITSDLITQLIIKFQTKFQTTSILISHDIKEVLKCSDFIAILHLGKIQICGTKDELQASKDPIVQQFLLGESKGPIKL